MAKEKKGINPADAFRKDQRKKELKKLKKDRDVVREVRSLLNNPTKIEEEIQRVQRESNENKLDKSLKDRIVELKRMKDVALQKEKMAIAPVRPPGATAAVAAPASGPPPPPTQALPARRADESVYFHPMYNPSGAPPPGMPAAFRPPVPPPPPMHSGGPYGAAASMSVGAGMHTSMMSRGFPRAQPVGLPLMGGVNGVPLPPPRPFAPYPMVQQAARGPVAGAVAAPVRPKKQAAPTFDPMDPAGRGYADVTFGRDRAAGRGRYPEGAHGPMAGHSAPPPPPPLPLPLSTSPEPAPAPAVQVEDVDAESDEDGRGGSAGSDSEGDSSTSEEEDHVVVGASRVDSSAGEDAGEDEGVLGPALPAQFGAFEDEDGDRLEEDEDDGGVLGPTLPAFPSMPSFVRDDDGDDGDGDVLGPVLPPYPAAFQRQGSSADVGPALPPHLLAMRQAAVSALQSKKSSTEAVTSLFAAYGDDDDVDDGSGSNSDSDDAASVGSGRAAELARLPSQWHSPAVQDPPLSAASAAHFAPSHGLPQPTVSAIEVHERPVVPAEDEAARKKPKIDAALRALVPNVLKKKGAGLLKPRPPPSAPPARVAPASIPTTSAAVALNNSAEDEYLQFMAEVDALGDL